MPETKSDIIARLQREILPLQGFRPMAASPIDVGLDIMRDAFPGGVFPLGAVHEFMTSKSEDLSCSSAFVSGIVGSLMKRGGAALWIGSSRILFPPAMKSFGIPPERIIFIDLLKERDVLWAMEEALKCEGLAAVVGEVTDISLNASRRLQLAVEKSRVTGFVIRRNPRKLSTTAFVTRWNIHSMPSGLPLELPGVGFPRWKVELLKVRNGRPSSWELEWIGGKFRHVPAVIITEEVHRKTG